MSNPNFFEDSAVYSGSVHMMITWSDKKLKELYSKEEMEICKKCSFFSNGYCIADWTELLGEIRRNNDLLDCPWFQEYKNDLSKKAYDNLIKKGGE